jgi:hypothetical protein
MALVHKKRGGPVPETRRAPKRFSLVTLPERSDVPRSRRTFAQALFSHRLRRRCCGVRKKYVPYAELDFPGLVNVSAVALTRHGR